jgi:DNA-binding response OmpR family regulator
MDNKVLIIDDDEDLCTELTEILEDEGYDVHVASNGTMGRGMIEEDSYGVIILDIKLPGMSGTEILKTIRDKKIKQKVLVFSGKPLGNEPLSTNDQERESTEIIMRLADAVLNKPVPIEILLSKIKELNARV